LVRFVDSFEKAFRITGDEPQRGEKRRCRFGGVGVTMAAE
jgi:hypothetical protein